MPDWLTTTISSGSPAIPPGVLAWRIAGALVLGAVVAGLCRWARRGEPVQATFLTTLILLSTVIAMATQVIGDNVARAFSLVGALSVVRFRTVVKDTQDTAFVIFAVVVGMASGANHLAVALVGLGVVGVASLVMWPKHRPDEWRREGGKLSLRVAPADAVRGAVARLLDEATERSDLVAASTARQGKSLDLAYRVRLRAGRSAATLVIELNAIEGVENVEISRGD